MTGQPSSSPRVAPSRSSDPHPAPRRSPDPRRDWRHAVVGGSLLLLTVAHFVTPPHLHELHDLLFKLTFLPLILAGLWLGVGGTLFWSGITTGAYLVHVFGQLHGHAHPVLAWVGDVVLYNVVSLTTAVLTERREQARRRAEEQAERLEEQTRALLRAEEAARRSDRLRALGELSAGMAHEFRNPLGGIRGAAEVLRAPDTPREAREEFGELLETEIARLDRVVAAFLDFAKPREASREPVALADAVQPVLLLVGPQAREARVDLRADVPGDLLLVTDPTLLRQVLLNLVLNAVQAQPDGGEVLVAAAQEEGRVRIDVTDRGPGVPEELGERIFDPYVTGREGGTGLGLSVVARVVESLGGDVRLVPDSDRGSTFRVRLPL